MSTASAALLRGRGHAWRDGGDGARNGFIPIALAGLPTESHAGAAVLIAGFENKIFAVSANKG